MCGAAAVVAPGTGAVQAHQLTVSASMPCCTRSRACPARWSTPTLRSPLLTRMTCWPVATGTGGLCSAGGVDRRGVADSQAQMLTVVDGLVEEHRDVVVIQAVDDVLTGAFAGDQAEVAQ